jgi:hypothetical protein
MTEAVSTRKEDAEKLNNIICANYNFIYTNISIIPILSSGITVHRKIPIADTVVSGSYTTLLFQTHALVKVDVQIDHDDTNSVVPLNLYTLVHSSRNKKVGILEEKCDITF